MLQANCKISTIWCLNFTFWKFLEHSENVVFELLKVGNTDIVPKFLLCCFFVCTLLLLNKSNPFWAVLLCSNFFQIICTLSSLEFPSKNWTCSIFFHSSQNSYDRCYGSFRLQPSLIGFLLSTYKVQGKQKNWVRMKFTFCSYIHL